MLQLRLLGPPEVRLDGTLLSALTSKKSLALLFYLATTGRTHLRDELASLFWAEMPDAQARKNLRNILPTLRALLGPHLTITRHTLGFNHTPHVWLDVAQFGATFTGDWRNLKRSALSETLALYGGDFLTGFYVSDAPAFEEWMIGQRDRLHLLAVRGLVSFVEDALTQAMYQQGLAATQRLLQLEPWYEKAHQLQMALLAASGERDRALRQYEHCRQVLSSEFGVEPTLETNAAYARIKAGLPLHRSRGDQLVHAVGASVVRLQQEPPPAPLKLAAMQAGQPDLPPLYGREEELHRLLHWIANEQCRLVQITGMIGTGKTALAHHVAQLLQTTDQALVDGLDHPQILWHSCRDMRSVEQLLHDWLEQLVPGYAATSREAREALLLDQLRRRRCLLVLDDVERLASLGLATIWRLIEGIVASEHQSCLLLVGRELPVCSTYFEVTTKLARSLCLEGLTLDAAHMLLVPYELKGNAILKSRLIEQYDGMPLFLNLAARIIQGLGHATLEVYIGADAPLFDAVRTVLDSEFAALEMLEQTIITRLAATPQTLTLPQLHQALARTAALPELLSALQRLQRRSLLLTTTGGFTLPRLIRVYAHTLVERHYQEPRPLCLRQPS